jgi:hypothetical protein
MVAVPLIFGRLTADDYNDAVAADPRIDACATGWRSARTRSSPGLFRPGQALHRQRGAGVLQGRQLDRQGVDRLPDRPPQAPRPRASRCCWPSSRPRCGPICRRRRPTGCWPWRPNRPALDAVPVQTFMDLYRVADRPRQWRARRRIVMLPLTLSSRSSIACPEMACSYTAVRTNKKAGTCNNVLVFLTTDFQGAEHEQETPLCRHAVRSGRCAGRFRSGVRRPLVPDRFGGGSTSRTTTAPPNDARSWAWAWASSSAPTGRSTVS